MVRSRRYLYQQRSDRLRPRVIALVVIALAAIAVGAMLSESDGDSATQPQTVQLFWETPQPLIEHRGEP